MNPRSMPLLLAAVAVSAWACSPEPKKPQRPDLVSLMSSAEEAHGPPLFEDVTDRSKVQFTYRNGEESGYLTLFETQGEASASSIMMATDCPTCFSRAAVPSAARTTRRFSASLASSIATSETARSRT